MRGARRCSHERYSAIHRPLGGPAAGDSPPKCPKNDMEEVATSRQGRKVMANHYG